MSYRGRSPINDVTRAVVLGAAMISPAVLAACASAPPNPQPIPIPPEPPTDPSDPGKGHLVASDDAGAPATNVVRPRGTDPNNMPTRGFRGRA